MNLNKQTKEKKGENDREQVYVHTFILTFRLNFYFKKIYKKKQALGSIYLFYFIYFIYFFILLFFFI